MKTRRSGYLRLKKTLWQWHPKKDTAIWSVDCSVCDSPAVGFAGNVVQLKAFCDPHAELFMLDRTVNG